MSDGDMGGFDHSVDSDFGSDFNSDFGPNDGSDCGPPLEGPEGAGPFGVDPPEPRLYIDGQQGPPQAMASGWSQDRTPGQQHAAMPGAAADGIIPAMLVGSLVGDHVSDTFTSQSHQSQHTPQQSAGCASMMVIGLFTAVAFFMAFAVFKAGFGLFGVIPLLMAFVGLAMLASRIGHQVRNEQSSPPAASSLPPARPAESQQARHCVYCGRKAHMHESGCAGCGGPIDSRQNPIQPPRR